MSAKRNEMRGWIGTLAVHALVALILFLWKVNTAASEPEFVEVSFGKLPNIRIAHAPRPAATGSVASSAPSLTSLSASKRVVDPPERKFNDGDEVFAVPRSKKLDVPELSSHQRNRPIAGITGSKDRGAGLGTGEKENARLPGAGEFSTGAAEANAQGSAGQEIGSSVAMSVQWSDGGTRKKISGELPEYPPGVNVAAQIVIEAVVMPAGDVKGLKPSQKGNTKLEEAALRAVRLWKFEPLRKSSPQREQSCKITFNFLLK